MERSLDDLRSPATPPALRDAREAEIAALLAGAGLLLRAGNRVAAIAALWSAVGIDPCHRAAHRRLAAALANGGDVGGAVAEYERYFDALTMLGLPDRAAAERQYGHALLGDAIPLGSGTLTTAPPRIGSGILAHPHDHHRLDADQSQALRRVAVAAVALVATFAAMLIAGSQIFAQGL